ncbi:MAG: SH3 domain-containing protein, partial [Saprospiraceae bacterium]|nr:SH3 domain-containing protein [Saprospiraceae bacterium]
MKYALFSIVLCFIFPGKVQTSNPWTEGQYLNVYANSGLKLRTEPNRHAEVLDIVRYGDQVKLLNSFSFNEEMSDRIDWIDGHWVLVEYDGLAGYLFDGYLSALPFPDHEDQLCTDGYSYAYTLGQYMDQHYRVERILDSSDHKLTYLLINGGKVKRSIIEDHWSIEIQVSDIKINEVLNLMRSMIPDKASRTQFERSLLFIENDMGQIEQIKINVGEPV